MTEREFWIGVAYGVVIAAGLVYGLYRAICAATAHAFWSHR